MLRMVLEDYGSSYEELLSKCGMSTLEIQRARTLAVEVYKSIHQMTPIYIQEMFNIKITPYDLRDPYTDLGCHVTKTAFHISLCHIKQH